MKSYTEKLHEELLKNLKELDNQYDPKQLTDPRLKIIAETIDQIKEKLKTHFFSNPADEVVYFKSVLPPSLALHIYYAERIQWDRIDRQGLPECRCRYRDQINAQAASLRKEYKTFFEYCRDGETGMDNFFFLRNSPINREIKYQLRRIVDPSSPPLHCEILATLIAYTRLEQDLNISSAENIRIPSPAVPDEPGLTWTGTKVSLTQLAYALRHSSLINNGNVSLRKLIAVFEKIFSIDLGNTSKQFQEMQTRKMNLPDIFDKLKESFQKAVDEVDEEYHRKQKPRFGNSGLYK